MMDDDELLVLSARLGVSPNDILSAQDTGSWPEEIRKILIEQARKKHSRGIVPHPTSGGPWTFPPQAPAAPATPKAPPLSPGRRPAKPLTPPAANAPSTPKQPILMRATLRVHFSKFSKDFLPEEVIHEMMRNQVVPALPSTIPSNMLEWCEKNCADLWMPSPPAKPEYIMFASGVDMDLFLTAFGGG